MLDLYTDPADAEATHPRIIWTLSDGREIISSGASGMTAETLAASVIAAGVVPDGTPWREVEEDYVIPPSVEELRALFTAHIQARLDEFAQTRNYDNALACASYAASSNTKFAAEGQYMVEARDATWAKAYEILDVAMASGSIPSWEELETALDAAVPLEWPVKETRSQA